MTDEMFAELANDAEWFDARQLMVSHTKALGMLAK